VTTFLQFLIAGLNVGSVYLLIALGWVVLQQVAKVENLAQGAFVVYGSLLFISLKDDWNLPLAVAILGSLAGCLLLGAVLYLLVLNRFSRRGEEAPVVITLGAALVLMEVARWIWGLEDRLATPYLPRTPIKVMGATVLPHSLLVWAGTAVLVVGGFLAFERTILGKALRACAESYEGAQIVGINPARMQFASFQLAALYGGAGGVMLSPLIAVGWSSVIHLGILGLIGAVAGRWNYLSTAIASLGLGLLGSFAGGYISTSWEEVFIYGPFLAVLILTRDSVQRRTVSRRLGLRQRRSATKRKEPTVVANGIGIPENSEPA